jgi:hypothetical protein
VKPYASPTTHFGGQIISNHHRSHVTGWYGIKSHYETTLARVKDYYGLQMSYDRFTKMINNLNLLRKQRLDLKDYALLVEKFIEEFDLLDFRTFREAPVQTA